eukprot:537418-Alexandrium_andersonii.AAC.1
MSGWSSTASAQTPSGNGSCERDGFAPTRRPSTTSPSSRISTLAGPSWWTCAVSSLISRRLARRRSAASPRSRRARRPGGCSPARRP